MPFYDFACPDCASTFSLQRSMSGRDDPTECPDCHGTHSVRQLSMPAVMTRGDNGNLQSLSGSSCGGCTASSCGGCPSSK